MRKTLLTFSTDSWSLALKCKEIDEPVSRVEIIVKNCQKSNSICANQPNLRVAYRTNQNANVIIINLSNHLKIFEQVKTIWLAEV